MTIAVTAASGQLGRAIIRSLVDRLGPDAVIGLARMPDRAADLDVQIRPGDYDDPVALQASLHGVDTVLLVSGMASPQDRIPQHRNVMDAARKAGVRKIVYTSIQGPDQGTPFSPVVQSNRQTEADLRDSGLAWAIGRNGIYIEPDLDYLDSYKSAGKVANSAGDGLCGYTTRDELAAAYAGLLTGDAHDGKVVNLHGAPITQARLVDLLNLHFGTTLTYQPVSDAEFAADRTAELGDFIGPIIAGIYQGIRLGSYDNRSDFRAVTGRDHVPWDVYFAAQAARLRKIR